MSFFECAVLMCLVLIIGGLHEILNMLKTMARLAIRQMELDHGDKYQGGDSDG